MKKILCFGCAALAAMVFGRSVSLDWRKGGDQPVEVIDFGPQTVGGYAVFEVKDFTPSTDGTRPVLRLSYATHPDGLSPTGDFSREDHADYLHVDNPVLPANINRHELYTIPRKGTFVAPLLQGQERYVRVALDTPGTSVRLFSFDIVNAGVYSEAPAVGSFACDDPRAKAVWDMGARTCQLASFPNPDAWRVVAGALIPRKLEKGSADGTLTIDFTVPEGTVADVAGGPGAGPRRYGPGRHAFTRAVPPEELVDPTFAEGTAEGPQARDFGFVTSQPFDDASAHYAQTFDLDVVAAVDSVTFFPSGEGFPDSLTIEGGDKPGEFRELARRTGLKSADRKKPLTIDLRTVVGAPDVRYLRLSGDGLAKFGDGKRWGFRFANIRVNFTVR